MKKSILKFLSLGMVMFWGLMHVEAASFTISASRNLSKGNSTKLTIKGSDVTGRFNISSSNPSVISISENKAWIENDSYAITLSALNVGTSTITVTPSGVSDGSGNQVGLGAKSITITVALPREKSTDNNLKSLSVEGYEITPAFSSKTTDYSLSVPEGTQNINILATANSPYAKITGNGNVAVTEGVNNLSIVVKAENGKEKIYNLVVNVVDANPINVNVSNENYTLVKLRSNFACPASFTESETVINNTTIPTCTNNKLNYVLVGLKNSAGEVKSFIYKDNKYTEYLEVSSSAIKIIVLDYAKELKGYERANITINDKKYNAFKLNNSNRLYLVYGINVETGEKDFYLYDTTNKTFSFYNITKEDQNSLDKNIYLYVSIFFGIGLFLALICLIKLNRTNKKLKKNYQNDRNNLRIKNEEDETELEE